MKKRTAIALAMTLALATPLTVQAHRAWLLPSATVMSGTDVWVTFDAAVSNDLFYFEHNPLRLDNLVVFAPDGAALQVENRSTGRYRSTFDLRLAQAGTYKIAVVNNGVFASYKVGNETKRWRGTAETFAREVPADAQDLRVTEGQSRLETFVTAGKPTRTVLQPTNVGLELAPDTHPNDLFAGETVRFGFLLDGKPASGVKVTIIPGGIRYRDRLEEVHLTADQDGKVNITWPQSGMYWLEAAVRDDKTTVAQAKERRASYVATFEVLAP